MGTYVHAATSTTRMPFMMGFTVRRSFAWAGRTLRWRVGRDAAAG